MHKAELDKIKERFPQIFKLPFQQLQYKTNTSQDTDMLDKSIRHLVLTDITIIPNGWRIQAVILIRHMLDHKPGSNKLQRMKTIDVYDTHKQPSYMCFQVVHVTFQSPIGMDKWWKGRGYRSQELPSTANITLPTMGNREVMAKVALDNLCL